MKRLVHYPMIIWIACCPFVQACSSNGNPPPALPPTPKVEVEASQPPTRSAETVQEETVQKETHPIIKKVAVTKATLPTTSAHKREEKKSIPDTAAAETAAVATKATKVTETKKATPATEPKEAEEATPVTEAPKAQKPSKVTDPSGIAQRYIAAKTNIAYHAALVNNLAVEVQVSKHLSVELPIIWSSSEFNDKHALRAFAVQPEVRWWMSEAGRGHFFGLHAHVAWFNVKWDNNRYQDVDRPLLGGGLSYGYLLPLSAHWGAEFTLGAGYANTKYDTYYNIDNGALFSTDDTKHYWGITRVGLSLVYRF